MVGVGSQLGGYTLTAKLGTGGFASLYLGRKTGPSGFTRLAAVKVVHSHLMPEEKFRLMFADEAQINTRVQHPNIVRVEDFGEHAGTLYMVMEYVYGCSLAELLQQLSQSGLRLDVPLAVWVLMNVADALHAAHDAYDEDQRPLNIVHRDVSPQNVLLSYHGYVKLIDFGIAKATYRRHITRTGGVKGKLRYMAPEQAASNKVDRRIDVYALGVVAWEMLTMRRAFRSSNPLELLRQIQNPNIPRASTLADVPSAVDDVVVRAMAREPGDRYATARTLRRELAKACPEALLCEPRDLAKLLEDNLGRIRPQPQEGVETSDFARPLPPAKDLAPIPNLDAPGTNRLTDELPVDRWEPAEDLSIEELSLSDVAFEDVQDMMSATVDESDAVPSLDSASLEHVQQALSKPKRKRPVMDTIQDSAVEVIARLQQADDPHANTPPPRPPAMPEHLSAAPVSAPVAPPPSPAPPPADAAMRRQHAADSTAKVRQRSIATVEMRRGKVTGDRRAWVMFAIVLAVMAVVVATFAFLLMRALF
ncbi:MAG: serine/threonine protein kinase [Sandaracinaceae bacterium]